MQHYIWILIIGKFNLKKTDAGNLYIITFMSHVRTDFVEKFLGESISPILVAFHLEVKLSLAFRSPLL